jgi:hypothetical protein
MARFIATPNTTTTLVAITTNYSANPNETILADTAGGPITVTIPSSTSAVIGSRISIVDPAGTFGTYNCVVGTTTSITKIAALNENLTLNVPYTSVELLYSGASYGWVILKS